MLFEKGLFRNGKLFRRFAPEYIKLHLNKSNVGQATLSLCEYLFRLSES